MTPSKSQPIFNRSRTYAPGDTQSSQSRGTLDRASTLAATRPYQPNLSRPLSRQSNESSLPSLDQSYDRSPDRSFDRSSTRSPPLRRTFIEPPHLHPHLTDSEMKDLHTAFKAFDRRGLGSIDPLELKELMLALGFTKHSNKLLDVMIDEIDTERNLTFKDFLSLMESHAFSTVNQSINQSVNVRNGKTSNKQSRIELEYLFTLLDGNNDGYVDRTDLSRVFQSLHESINERDLLVMIDCADKNGDGRVSKQEFCDMMTREIE